MQWKKILRDLQQNKKYVTIISQLWQTRNKLIDLIAVLK